MLYVTCKDNNEAKKIAKYLLKKKIIACANIFPINSLYRWKGKLQKDKEFVLLAKTQKNKLYSLEKEVKGIHSYEIPCILQINAKANKVYGEWLKNELKK